MTLRAARILVTIFGFFILPALATAADGRAVVTSENSDYFGFDLRSEQNVTLDRCKSACLADDQCRAFTYNTRAKWCFLKSDYSTLKPFDGAVAGKIVDLAGEPDIGAAPTPDFFAADLRDDAQRFRNDVVSGSAVADGLGIGFLMAAADSAEEAGNPRDAIQFYRQAIAVSPDDGDLWSRMARAAMAVPPANGTERSRMNRIATSASWNAYRLSRTASVRADTLVVMAEALERREFYRPALDAYEASLALVNNAGVRAAYLDLKARKGFRVVDHTIDSDIAAPRICAQFSEDLVKSGVDYASYVTVDGGPPVAVDAKGDQFCVEGLEHGEQYTVAFRPGLPAAIGDVMENPVTLDVYVRDRSPSIRFTGDDFVLPGNGRHGIPLVSVNTDSADIEVFRVGDRALARLLAGSDFLRQLDQYDIGNIRDDLGAAVWKGKIDIAGELNDETVTSFPVDEALPDRKPGVYVLTARPEGDRSESWISQATQWFVVSDIGLSTFAGDDGLHVFARSLDTAKPLTGAKLTLLARNNEVLGTAATDADGAATFTAGLTRGENGMVPAALTARGENGDFVFLDMTRAGFDLSDRGVTGRAAPGALDVYAWTERGIYRAGETVHAAALSRNDTAEAVENLPLTFIFSRPDGVEDRRIVSADTGLGGHAVDLDLQSNAMRGTWQMRIYTDPEQPPVAEKMFLVEDFVPDRIEFDLTADADTIAVGEPENVTVDGRFLYGAPAAGLQLEGEVRLSPVRERTGYAGYQFGLADEDDEEISTVTPLDALPDTGDDGVASFELAVDEAPATTRPLNAAVTVRMRESGGRAVERSIDLAVAPDGPMIGIRPEFAGQELQQGSTARFRVIAVDQNGERVALDGLTWSLVKIERNYQWYRRDNGWNYEPVTYTTKVADGTVDASVDEEASVSVAVDWGRYRLEVESDDAAGPASSVEFDAGWYVEASSTETPDGLEIALDRETYAPGDVARLQISPRFAGEVLVTVGADRLVKTMTATVPEGGATLDIPVTADWGAGAYVTATLYRPGADQETRMPMRAIGVKWLSVDPGERKLDVALTPPAKTEPRQPLVVPVSVDGANAGDAAWVTVAAVDVGILNLTDFEAPDPDGWYFGQRRLGVEIRDLYGRLIDGSLGVTGRIRTGGDGGGMMSQGSPPTEKLVAFFSGPVKLDADGKTEVRFDIPQFNGTVRVMAVAWSKTGVGHTQTDVIVREPVVVTAGLPRFMAPGDEAEMRLDIANTDGPAGDYTLDIVTNRALAVAPGGAPQTVSLAGGGTMSLTVPLSAVETGDGDITVKLASADGTTVEHRLAMTVRPAAMPVTTRRIIDLAAGKRLTIDGELLADSLLDGASVSVGVSPLAAFDVPSLLMSLDRYPYGCAEQTTSRALPLLYVGELSASAGLEADADIHKRVQDAIYRVISYQTSTGSYGLWGPGYGDLWLDSYVTDFLTRAREQDYQVPAEAMRLSLENLQNSLAYDIDIKDRGDEIAYALYVLARNRKAAIGDLRYYTDAQIDNFATPMARAQLGASLALYGDPQRSERAFMSALRLARSASTTEPDATSDYGSPLRDGAAMLALAAETRPLPGLVPEMIAYVADSRQSRDHTSTQEEAWMLLAARALSADAQSIRLTINGEQHSGAFAERVSGTDLLDRPVTVENTGDEQVQAVVTTIAAPAQPLPAGGDGFSIGRTYYHLDGSEANVTEARQNERFVVVIKANEQNAWPSRVLVTDLLPAGFQIDNPRLVGSADLSNFDWLGSTEAAHVEFRDDRFVAAFDRVAGSDREFTMAYVVRAVTPGVYAHPAAQVEDMYRPQFQARTAAGVMEVVAAR